MNEDHELTLWLGALRYYMGRRTIAVSHFCEMLIVYWPKLGKKTRELIKRDLTEEIERNERKVEP